MKKILLAFDGGHFSAGAFEFARRLNELQPVLLTGVFLPETELAGFWSDAGGMVGTVQVPLPAGDDSEPVQQNIGRFENLCQHSGIEYRVHKDFSDLVMDEMKRESRYADLLILGSEVFYKDAGASGSDNYLEDTLHHVSCPVILVPENDSFPERIILAYDGSNESVYAIKQFAYLFPELMAMETNLVYAAKEPGENFPDEILVEELVARHYKNLELTRLELDPKKYFSTWITDEKSPLLVSGAYGRSAISRLLKKSFVTDVIATHQLPVFIAHR
jgi:nucleotide-binding universal stress UspA family protein